MNYQQKLLVNMSDIGAVGPLPVLFDGVSDQSLADLYWAPDWFGQAGLAYVGTGFFPDDGTRRISRIGFMQRIPAAKRMAIRAASKTNPIIEDFLDLLSATDLVELDNADTVAGLGYLVNQTLLTDDDVAVIRA